MNTLTAFLLIFSLLFPFTVSAHPGRTDENGGHYCRTNCEKLGYKQGEYHYHGVKIKEAKTEARKKAR